METKFPMLTKSTLIVLLVLFLFSCTKTAGNQNTLLIGTWRLTGTYDGYANGGNFKWSLIDSPHSAIMTFSALGQFEEIEFRGNGYPTTCAGTYLLKNVELRKLTPCNSNDVQKITELTDTSLITDAQVIEGVIRFKYIRQ